MSLSSSQIGHLLRREPLFRQTLGTDAAFGGPRRAEAAREPWRRYQPPCFCPETTEIFPAFARVKDMAAGDWSCGVILAFGDFAMDSRASGRLALEIAAAVLL